MIFSREIIYQSKKKSPDNPNFPTPSPFNNHFSKHMKSLLATTLALFTLIPLALCPNSPFLPNLFLADHCQLECDWYERPDPSCTECILNQVPGSSIVTKTVLKKCIGRLCPPGWVWSLPCKRCVPGSITFPTPILGKCKAPCPRGWVWDRSCHFCVPGSKTSKRAVKQSRVGKKAPGKRKCSLRCPDGFKPNPSCKFCIAAEF